MLKRLLSLFALMTVAACATSGANRSNLPHGSAAYQVIPPAAPGEMSADYKIGPLDSIDVNVYQEPDLSVKKVQVDASGNVALPLVGTVAASGKTASELSKELATRFEAKYLNNPQVTVVVASSVSQKVVVQGEVTEPGVYEIKGPTTLLEAISLAKGETRVAALKDVAVFRNVNGQRMGAVFDINSIRAGQAKDPELVGNDVVVVGFSAGKSMWRDVLSATPLLNIFRPLAF
ncbi:MAG TPA: polysaccharide biosynthesis/export family protein [Allosphingosinicella sp.]|nr:polysaccharide biosynthesis/export family protein [Allosphingosinicella sp.]